MKVFGEKNILGTDHCQEFYGKKRNIVVEVKILACKKGRIALVETDLMGIELHGKIVVTGDNGGIYCV